MNGPTTIELPLEGGCHCGKLRFSITEAPLFSMACHCKDCQKFTASAFSLALAVPSSGVHSLEGNSSIYARTADSGNTSRQFFCDDCGNWVATRIDEKPEITIVRAMQLDENDWFRPIGQMFTRSALPWTTMATALSWETEWGSDAEIEAMKTAFSQGFTFTAA